MNMYRIALGGDETSLTKALKDAMEALEHLEDCVSNLKHEIGMVRIVTEESK